MKFHKVKAHLCSIILVVVFADIYFCHYWHSSPGVILSNLSQTTKA